MKTTHFRVANIDGVFLYIHKNIYIYVYIYIYLYMYIYISQINLPLDANYIFLHLTALFIIILLRYQTHVIESLVPDN